MFSFLQPEELPAAATAPSDVFTATAGLFTLTRAGTQGDDFHPEPAAKSTLRRRLNCLWEESPSRGPRAVESVGSVASPLGQRE